MGVPLALSIACEIIVRKGNTSFLDQVQHQQATGFLVAELTKDIDSTALMKYTEAASVISRFDQEILQSILLEDVPVERFREFCRLPYVISHEKKWILHDSVRQWFFTDLQNRMPQTFHNYRRRAFASLSEREANHPDKNTNLPGQKISLLGSIKYGPTREQIYQSFMLKKPPKTLGSGSR